MKITFLQNVKIFELLNDLLKEFIGVFPNIIGAILLFVIGWIIAKVASGIVKKVLGKVGIDKIAEKLNTIDFIEKTNINFVPSTILSKILYYFVILIFAIAATDQLNMPAVSNLVSDIIRYIPQLLTAGIVLVIGVLFADFIKKIVYTTTESLGIPSGKIISSFVFYFLILAVLMTALAQADINVAFFEKNITVIIAGGVFAFALGYGIASKDMMANFLASLYTKKKINIGDVIKIDGIKGEVMEIDNSSFTLQTDENTVVIPLSKLTTEKIEFFN